MTAQRLTFHLFVLLSLACLFCAALCQLEISAPRPDHAAVAGRFLAISASALFAFMAVVWGEGSKF